MMCLAYINKYVLLLQNKRLGVVFYKHNTISITCQYGNKNSKTEVVRIAISSSSLYSVGI